MQNPDSRDFPSFLGRPVYDWGADLQQDDPATRRTAAFALAKIGEPAAHYGPDLRALLNDPDPGVREAAALALGEFGSSAGTQTVPALQRLLSTDASPAVRRGAACALGGLARARGESTEPLRQALGDADPRVRQSAAWALGRIGESVSIASAVSGLRELLHDSDVSVRRDAAAALGGAGPEAKPAVADLIALLADPDPVVPPNAAGALGKIGTAAELAVPLLVRLVQNSRTEEDLRHQAAFALSQIGGPKVAQALPSLREALRDKDVVIRRAVSVIFVNFGDSAQFYIPDLALALSDEDVEVRRSASAALEMALRRADDAQSKAVVSSLLKLLHDDPDGQVRLHVAWVFVTFRGDLHAKEFAGAKDVLIKAALHDRERMVRSNAARAAVKHFGTEARAVAPTLIEILKSRHNSIRIVGDTAAKVTSSGSEGTGARTSVDSESLGDGRALAAEFLGRLGDAAGPEAKAALQEASRDPDSAELRDAAKEALRKFR